MKIDMSHLRQVQCRGFQDLITAVVLTSPIPSHPSRDIIDQTIASIRHHFKDISIVVMCDGVRPEQEHLRPAYREYLNDLMKNPLDSGVAVWTISQHLHQVGLMREFLVLSRSPLIFFSEHDTPLVTEEPIEWAAVIPTLINGRYNSVRFLPEVAIHPEHQYLMCGCDIHEGIPFVRTKQFSARPHLATRQFYLKAMQCFSPQASSFVEDKMHSVCQTDSWEDWRMAIYAPEGNMKRSLHLDGRAGGDKFDERQIF